MGKNIKSYATTQVPPWYGLTVHIRSKFTSIIFFKSLSFGQIYSELHKISSFRSNLQRIMQNLLNSPQNIPHHSLIHHVSEACPSRERSEIPANYTNSAQFTHIVRE